MDVTLRLDQADDPPPPCPACAQRQMRQEFQPPRIVGSTAARARDLAQTIAHEDYHVADMQMDRRRDSTPKVRYKYENVAPASSTWGIAHEAVQAAITAGRDTRLKYGGSGLDILQKNLKDGTQPDLIELSKKRCMRIW